MNTPTPSLHEPEIRWHRRVLRLAFPVALANLTQPVLGAVDTVLAGHLGGAEDLGGVALGGIFFGFVFWSFGFLRMGTTGLVAQSRGARDQAGMRAHLIRALLLACAIGIILLAVRTPLIAVVLHLIGGSDAVQFNARLYSHARIWAAPLALINYVVLGYLLACQRVRLALWTQILINVANVAAALLYVYAFNMGIAGIGAATATADAVGCVLGLAILWHLRVRTLPPLEWRALCDAAEIKRLIIINRDIFVRTLCLLGSVGWFAHLGARAGDTILAANAILLNFQTFLSFGLDGFAQAAETLVGEAAGERNRAHFKKALNITFLWSTVGAVLLAVLYGVAGGPIVDLLTDHPDVREAAHRYLPWVALTPVASLGGFLLDGVFIGATRTGALMKAMLFSMTFFLLTSWILTSWLGNHGLWLSFILFLLVRGATLAVQLPSLSVHIGQARNA